MIIRSKAPLRLGLAGGGTDVSPYADLYGWAILNVTIDMYAHATIKPTAGNKIKIIAADRNEEVVLDATKKLKTDGTLDLAKSVYNRVVKDFLKKPVSFELTTFVDAPAGSGLGSSSTLVVAILGAFVEWFKLPLGDYDIAHLAYEIEREDLGMQGGKQDQYAATFGGVNYMEFNGGNKVIVNPLRVKEKGLHELGHNLILFSTETSRLSSTIIAKQSENVRRKNAKSIEAMHGLKEQAVRMKEALLKGNVHDIGKILHDGWEHKKSMAEGISNPQIERIYKAARKAGAIGGKLSGAGGGGFMIFYAPETAKFKVIETLNTFGGRVVKYNFTEHGLRTWTI